MSEFNSLLSLLSLLSTAAIKGERASVDDLPETLEVAYSEAIEAGFVEDDCGRLTLTREGHDALVEMEMV